MDIMKRRGVRRTDVISRGRIKRKHAQYDNNQKRNTLSGMSKLETLDSSRRVGDELRGRLYVRKRARAITPLAELTQRARATRLKLIQNRRIEIRLIVLVGRKGSSLADSASF